MKLGVALAIALAATMAMPIVHAQQSADPSGDHELSLGAKVQGTTPPWQSAGGSYQEFDLVDLTTSQGANSITFHVIFQNDWSGQSDGVRSDGAAPVDGGWNMEFNIGAKRYQVNASQLHTDPQADLLILDGPLPSHVASLDFGEQGNGWVATVPVRHLSNELGEPWLVGDVLVQVSAGSYGHGGTVGSGGASAASCLEGVGGDNDACTVRVRDFMPNSGFLDDIVREQTGETPIIDVQMPRPLRGSNGQATTHLFPLFIQNNADSSQTLRIVIDEKPDDWAIHARSEFTLEPMEATQLIIAAQVPFRHVHGETEYAKLSLQGGPIEPEFEIGIRYLDVPAPSGHHPTLYFHAEDAFGQAWMNTMPFDERALDGALIGPEGETLNAGTEYDAFFALDLSPELVVDLDADLSRSGEAVFDIQVRVDADFQISGEILGANNDAGQWSVHKLFDLEAASISQSGELVMVAAPLESADHFRVADFARFTLFLEAHAEPDAEQLALMHAAIQESEPIVALGSAESSITLPLVDVDMGDADYIQGLADAIQLTGPATFNAGPGTAHNVPITVSAPEFDAIDFMVLSPEGVQALVPSSVIGPWPQTVELSVRIPDDAVIGSEVQVVLIAAPADGSPIEASRIVTFHVTDSTDTDPGAEKALEGDGKNSPAMPVAVALGIALALRRARRD